MSPETTWRDQRDQNLAPRVPVTRAGWQAWLLPLGLFFAALALQAFASRIPHFVEHYYSRTLFPPLSHALSRVNGLFAFSLAELMVIAIVPILVGALIYQGRQIYCRRSSARKIIRADLLTAIWIAGSV